MGDKVTIACKLPNGLLLRTFNMVKRKEPVMGGGYKEVPEAVFTGHQVVVAGPAAPSGQAPKFPVMGGFALTHGVDKDFWEAWLKQNQDLDAVKNGLIFAQGDVASLRDEVKEKKGQKSGLEAIDPRNLPKKIEQADESAKPELDLLDQLAEVA